MNCALHPKEKSVAVGKENECHLLSIDINKTSKSKKSDDSAEVEYKVSTLCSEVTVKCSDEDDDGDFQKVVRFTNSGEHIVTGGSNGYVCVLQVKFFYLFLFHIYIYRRDPSGMNFT